MYPTPNKYDKIYVKSRNPYKTKNLVEKIIDDTYEQLRIHYKCESEYFKKLGYK
jgi:hemerythrin